MATRLRIYLGKERALYEQPLLGPTAERAGKRIRRLGSCAIFKKNAMFPCMAAG